MSASPHFEMYVDLRMPSPAKANFNAAGRKVGNHKDQVGLRLAGFEMRIILSVLSGKMCSSVAYNMSPNILQCVHVPATGSRRRNHIPNLFLPGTSGAYRSDLSGDLGSFVPFVLLQPA